MNCPAADTEVSSTVSGLSDDQLLEQTSKLAGLDHQVHVFVIDHLLEIEARRLYLTRGFSSLFDYVKRGLGYSDGATWRRISAMKLCARFKGVRERLWDGSLTLDAAAQLQAAFERRERQRARVAREGGTGSALRPKRLDAAGASAVRPAQAAPNPEPSPAPVLDLSAQKALVEQAAGKSTREVMQMLADVDPALAVPADRVRPLGEGRWELKAVIDAECQRGLEQLKGLLSHVDPRMTVGQLVGRLVSEGLDRHDPSRPPHRRRTRSAPASAGRSRAAQGANTDRPAASESRRSATHADATTSAARTPSGSSRSVPSPAQRRAQPEGAASSPANRQPKAARRATSAPKRSGGTDGTGASGSKTERDLNDRTPRASKRSVPTGSASASAPHMQPVSDRRAGSVGKQPARPGDNLTSAPKEGARAGRAIPAAIRREVWQRDGGRCCFVDSRSGRRCASRHLLQVDHVFPYALGGGPEPENLRLLCLAHHRDRHTERTSRRGPPA